MFYLSYCHVVYFYFIFVLLSILIFLSSVVLLLRIYVVVLMSVIWLVVCLFIFGHFAETAARETLEQVMAEALMKSGSNRFAVRAVCLAVSGVNHPTDQERILNWLRFDSIPLLQVKQSSGILYEFSFTRFLLLLFIHL